MRWVDDNRQLESLRLVRLGGEPVFQGDVEAFRQHCPSDCLLMHALSSTETGLICALMISKAMLLPGRRIPVGQAVRGVEVMLMDDNGQCASQSNQGRIAVRSAHLAQGYWLQPEATRESFRADAHDPENRVFLTADLGRLQPNGCLEHLGRADQQVKIRGRRIRPGGSGSYAPNGGSGGGGRGGQP